VQRELPDRYIGLPLGGPPSTQRRYDPATPAWSGGYDRRWVDPSRSSLQCMVQIGLVKMDDVETVCLRDDGFQAENFIGHRVLTVWIEAQRLLADRNQACPRLRITTREQRDVVSKLGKVLDRV
jgi:hypothetical protein